MPLLCIPTVEGLQRADYALSSPPLTTCTGHLASGPTLSPTGFLPGLFKHVAQPSTISLIPPYLTAWQPPSLVNLSPPVTSGFTCLVSSTCLAAPPLSLCCSPSPQGSVLIPHLFSHYTLSLGHPSKVHGFIKQLCLLTPKYIPRLASAAHWTSSPGCLTYI